jgi:glycosyltransferase involved in cell wall biosynthesis
MTLSLIIPAYNEERYLGATLESVKQAASHAFGEQARLDIVVVDNASDDATAEIAKSNGARVVPEPHRSVARARNAGASFATGEILVFLDADTLVPEGFFVRIAETMQDSRCFGGAVDTHHQSRRQWDRFYLSLWRHLARMTHMAQGAAQFCRRDAFVLLGGYDETLYMGEDVDFYWRLRRLAKQQGGTAHLIADIQVTPSPRRFERWSAWRILVWTNPLFIGLFRRRKSIWRGWYEQAVR